MLAYPHTLEDMFQRSGFTRQRLFARTPYLHCQRAFVPINSYPKASVFFQEPKNYTPT
jgi:hypothetical protein